MNAIDVCVMPDSVSDEAAVFVEPLAAAFRIMEQLPATAFGADRRVLIMGAGRLGHLTALAIATAPCQLTVPTYSRATAVHCTTMTECIGGCKI